MSSELLGPYRLEELIGRGGMGEVFRAYDTVRKRTVAVKRLPAALAGDAQFQARFRREAETAARLREPHIIPIHDFGEIDGQLFLDMRLVEGHNLGTSIDRVGPLPPLRAVNIVAQLGRPRSARDVGRRGGPGHGDARRGDVQRRDRRPPGASVRTVDHHVSAVLTKLGVTNRREAAAMAKRFAAKAEIG